MSVRGDAKVLYISHTYLSRLLNGRRQWTCDLYKRYQILLLQKREEMKLGTRANKMQSGFGDRIVEELATKYRAVSGNV